MLSPIYPSRRNPLVSGRRADKPPFRRPFAPSACQLLLSVSATPAWRAPYFGRNQDLWYAQGQRCRGNS
jgi:hypothetical protein